MARNLTKLFLIMTILGVYSASMYNLGIAKTNQELIEAPTHSPEDVQKILDVVKVQSSQEESMQYVPGVACVIQATPEMSVEEMESLFNSCTTSRSEHLQSVSFDR